MHSFSVGRPGLDVDMVQRSIDVGRQQKDQKNDHMATLPAVASCQLPVVILHDSTGSGFCVFTLARSTTFLYGLTPPDLYLRVASISAFNVLMQTL